MIIIIIVIVIVTWSTQLLVIYLNFNILSLILSIILFQFIDFLFIIDT